MYNQSHPRTTARASKNGRRFGAAATVVAVAAALTLSAAGAANADTKPVSWGAGQFLSGSVLGTNLDNIAELQAATASNNGTQGTVTSKDPLKATVLNSVNVGNGSSVQTNLGGVVQLGAVGQYATAVQDGTSAAATGAVENDGAIGVGEDKPVDGTNATVDLSALLGQQFASNLANLNLAIQAISAQAKADGTTASGHYTLADLKLNLTSPAISQLTEKVNAALDTVQNGLNTLDGSDGSLIVDVNQLLKKIVPSLNLLGGNSNVTVTIDAGDLHQLVADLLTAQYGESGVTFNLETGVVTLDLAKLLGVDINNLPPGTELLSDAIIGQALDNITGKVASIADQVVDRVKTALHNASVKIHANLNLDVAQAPLVQQVCNTVKKVIQVPTQVLQHVAIQVPIVGGSPLPVVGGVPTLGGIPIGSLGGVLNNTIRDANGALQIVTGYVTQYVDQYVTQYVSQTVDDLVCNNVTTPLPSLNTSVKLDVAGTVDNFINNSGVTATAAVKLLGVVNTKLDLSLLVGDLGGTLGSQLFGDSGTISKLVDALNTGLVDPAVSGLLNGSNAVGPALTDLVSVKANVQEIHDGTFTETALRVAVLGGTAGGGAQVNLAAASVGPNVTSTGDVGGVDTTPPGGGTGGTGGTGTSISALATTGVGIATLIAVILALLAAGAYLVRESYRRNHPVTIAE